jgi:hypothetical protein
MLDIKNLEQRWLKYKLKSFFPYIIASLVLFTLLIGVSLWFGSEKPNNHPSTEKPSKDVTPPVNKTLPIADSNQKTTLEPSMEFVQSFQNAPLLEEKSVAKIPTKNKPLESITKLPTPPKTLTMPEYTPPPSIIASDTKAPVSHNSTVLINESKLDIDDLQRRFKEGSNANLGLFITRYYYNQGNYVEAYNYALKTNTLNNRLDENWILFSKSLVKLGKADQAKKTLQVYISQSNSEAAQALLDSIEKGNFK